MDLATFTEEIVNGKLHFLCSVNPEVYLSIIIDQLAKLKDLHKFLTDDHKIDSENSVTLLGIERNNNLNFEKYVTSLYKKTGAQLNTLSRTHKYIGFP